MNITKMSLQWLGRSVVLVAATVVAAACSTDTLIEPTGHSTVPMYAAGGTSDSANALSLATDLELRQNDQVVDLTGCEQLTVPAGNKLATRVFARGAQIYRWSGTAWTLVGPSAKLYANAGSRGVVGTHYVGPTWETNSGNKVVGAVVDRCTRDANDIPWLLLRATSVEGSGLLHGVTFVHRVNTSGGVAPAIAGTVGQEVEIPYTAEYLFYRAK